MKGAGEFGNKRRKKLQGLKNEEGKDGTVEGKKEKKREIEE
jgi:hypothetical protein